MGSPDQRAVFDDFGTKDMNDLDTAGYETYSEYRLYEINIRSVIANILKWLGCNGSILNFLNLLGPDICLTEQVSHCIADIPETVPCGCNVTYILVGT